MKSRSRDGLAAKGLFQDKLWPVKQTVDFTFT